jgi:hypothetical protein
MGVPICPVPQKASLAILAGYPDLEEEYHFEGVTR